MAVRLRPLFDRTGTNPHDECCTQDWPWSELAGTAGSGIWKTLHGATERIFVAARELTPQLITDEKTTRQQVDNYITQIAAYTDTKQENGIRMVAFLSLRDLYALMAIKYINANSFDQAMNALKHATHYYDEVVEFPKKSITKIQRLYWNGIIILAGNWKGFK